MAEPAQQPLSATLQHPVVGMAATPVAPLRLDSGGEFPSSGKMVSLADLHVNSTPATPRDADGQASSTLILWHCREHMRWRPQAVDPLDPLLQNLVQDKLFYAAVQTSQLHAAAAAAVKVMKSYVGTQSNDFKRPMDRRFALNNDGGYTPRSANGSPRFPGIGTPSIGPAVRSMKQEVLQLEDAIPWTLVRRTWRNKRTSWRRQVKQTELVAEFAARLKELRISLLTDDATFIGCGATWRNHLDSCIQGRGSASHLVAVWDEMKNAIRSWLGNGHMGSPHSAGGSGPVSLGGSASFYLPASSGRAVSALQQAVRLGGKEALLQAPLESIVGNDTQNLHAVRQAIELERRIVAARLAAAAGGGEGGAAGAAGQSAPAVSYFTSISAAWEDSDFDSGAESDMDEGSDATDVDADFD